MNQGQQGQGMDRDQRDIGRDKGQDQGMDQDEDRVTQRNPSQGSDTQRKDR
jgi:hypothetical protein